MQIHLFSVHHAVPVACTCHAVPVACTCQAVPVACTCHAVHVACTCHAVHVTCTCQAVHVTCICHTLHCAIFLIAIIIFKNTNIMLELYELESTVETSLLPDTLRCVLIRRVALFQGVRIHCIVVRWLGLTKCTTEIYC